MPREYVEGIRQQNYYQKKCITGVIAQLLLPRAPLVLDGELRPVPPDTRRQCNGRRGGERYNWKLRDDEICQERRNGSQKQQERCEYSVHSLPSCANLKFLDEVDVGQEHLAAAVASQLELLLDNLSFLRLGNGCTVEVGALAVRVALEFL